MVLEALLHLVDDELHALGRVDDQGDVEADLAQTADVVPEAASQTADAAGAEGEARRRGRDLRAPPQLRPDAADLGHRRRAHVAHARPARARRLAPRRRRDVEKSRHVLQRRRSLVLRADLGLHDLHVDLLDGLDHRDRQGREEEQQRDVDHGRGGEEAQRDRGACPTRDRSATDPRPAAARGPAPCQLSSSTGISRPGAARQRWRSASRRPAGRSRESVRPRRRAPCGRPPEPRGCRDWR